MRGLEFFIIPILLRAYRLHYYTQCTVSWKRIYSSIEVERACLADSYCSWMICFCKRYYKLLIVTEPSMSSPKSEIIGEISLNSRAKSWPHLSRPYSRFRGWDSSARHHIADARCLHAI